MRNNHQKSALIVSELAKIKSSPERFLADLILEKQFRGMDGYAAQSRIPAMKLARARLKKDVQEGV